MGVLQHIESVGGTSSGAITACLLSVGYTPSEIADIIGNTNFGKFNDGGFIFFGGLYRLNRKLGYYKGNKFLHWLENLIEEKTGSKDITFNELYLLSKDSTSYKELAVAATSLNHQRTLVFAHDTYPDMRIADAVRASMAVPLYFEPLIIDSAGTVHSVKNMTREHDLCVDGGFTANFIISHYDSVSQEGVQYIAPTLGLRIDSDTQIVNDRSDYSLAYQPIHSAKDFIVALYYITKETMNRQLLSDTDWKRTISISDSSLGPKVRKLSQQEQQALLKSGRKGVQDYFHK
jgi:NTE family protein